MITLERGFASPELHTLKHEVLLEPFGFCYYGTWSSGKALGSYSHGTTLRSSVTSALREAEYSTISQVAKNVYPFRRPVLFSMT